MDLVHVSSGAGGGSGAELALASGRVGDPRRGEEEPASIAVHSGRCHGYRWTGLGIGESREAALSCSHLVQNTS